MEGKKVCYVCKFNPCQKEGEEIQFTYKGLIFRKVFVPDGMCCGCAQQRVIENYEKNCSGLVSIADGTLRIDWSIFSRAERVDRSSDAGGKMVEVLCHLGILCRQGEEEKTFWEVCTYDSRSLNPKSFHLYYFIREEDAKAYAEVRYGNVTYHVYLRRISNFRLLK